jgi:hypothetical protein
MLEVRDHPGPIRTAWEFTGVQEVAMPNRRRPIDTSTPEGRLAKRLRTLQKEAIARAASTAARRELSIDQIAGGNRWLTSKTAMYAALNGTRLPSTDTLSALAMAWDPRGEAGRQEWLRIRDEIEDELQADTVSAPPLSQPAVTASSVPLPHQESPKTAGSKEALIELRQRMDDARARRRLPIRALTARAMLGRTTVSRAFNRSAPAPSSETVWALGRALGVPEPEVQEWVTLLRAAKSQA